MTQPEDMHLGLRGGGEESQRLINFFLLCFLPEDKWPAELISLSGSLAAEKARQASSPVPRLPPACCASLLSQGPDSDPSEVMSRSSQV